MSFAPRARLDAAAARGLARRRYDIEVPLRVGGLAVGLGLTELTQMQAAPQASAVS